MAIDFNQNYFQLFELENSFDVNYESLEKKYLSFQKSFHPDKFVNASDQEKRISLQIISYILQFSFERKKHKMRCTVFVSRQPFLIVSNIFEEKTRARNCFSFKSSRCPALWYITSKSIMPW